MMLLFHDKVLTGRQGKLFQNTTYHINSTCNAIQALMMTQKQQH